jgi:hypothetical protein
VDLREIFRSAMLNKTSTPCSFCRNKEHTAESCQELPVAVQAYSLIVSKREMKKKKQVCSIKTNEFSKYKYSLVNIENVA